MKTGKERKKLIPFDGSQRNGMPEDTPVGKKVDPGGITQGGVGVLVEYQEG